MSSARPPASIWRPATSRRCRRRSGPISPRDFDAVAEKLEIDGEQHEHGMAKQHVLEACNLASAYGDQYDGYVDRFETAVLEYDVDPFDANEDEKLKYLHYPEWKSENEWLTYSGGDERRALRRFIEENEDIVRPQLQNAPNRFSTEWDDWLVGLLEEEFRFWIYG